MRHEGGSASTTVTRTDRETLQPGHRPVRNRPASHQVLGHPSPRRRGAAVAGLLGLGLVLSTGCAALDLMLVIDEPPSYLGGRSLGPYHGRVVDAETGEPLAGAVVVATWGHRRNALAHTWMVRYAAREAVTDADGRYHLEVRRLEEWAPMSTEPPTFRVFAPGYAYYRQGSTRWADARVAAPFVGHDTVVHLRRLRTPGERRQHLPELYEPLDRGNPFRHLPHFVRLVNREHVELGLPPHTEATYREYRKLSR